MPERWERELKKLRDVEMQEPSVRERIERGPTAQRPPGRERFTAAVVAGAVAVTAIAFLWQTLPETRELVGEATPDLPVLSVSFHDSEVIQEGPDSSYRRVQTAISYGDASEESFTSTISPNAHVDWVPADDLTRFVPGPTVGSAIGFQSDGDDPRVLLGRPADWPNFGQFERVERLPADPGDYVLVFSADYPEGIARTARLVRVVTPGVLQLDISEGKAVDAANAFVYVDGRRTEGFLSMSWFMAGDVGTQSTLRAPTFGPDAWLPLSSGTPITLGSVASEARAGLYPSYGDFDLQDRLPIDLLESTGVVDGPDGRQLLAVEATWTHGQVGWAHDGTEERALFFFPVEIVTEQETMPAPVETPSPGPVGEGAVVVNILRSSGETGDPEAIARLGGQEVWMCPDHWTAVDPDGTEESAIFDCGQTDVFRASVGTPITVAGDFATVNVTTRVSGDRLPRASDEVPALEAGTILTLGYEVTWDDGSEASFWLLLTVSEGSSTAESSVLRIRCGPVGAEVLTPVVAAQPDGVHLRIEDARPLDAVEFANAAEPNGSFGGPVRDGTGVWPIEPGMFYVECLESLAETYQGLETARFEVVDPNGYWVPGTPGCREEDRLLKVSTYESGGADYVDDETTIRALMHSIEPMDEVRLPFYPEGGGAKDLRYVVVRDEHVIASLSVGLSDDQDPYGPGLTEVTGQACASSGIAQGSID